MSCRFLLNDQKLEQRYFENWFVLKLMLLLNLFLLYLNPAAQAQSTLPLPYLPGSPINFVRVWETSAPISTPGTLSTRPLRDVKQTTKYFDGLGRPLQTVYKQGSMVTDSSAIDMVDPIVYDRWNREEYKYLSFAANNTGGNTSINDGLFKLNPFQQDSTFIRAMHPNEFALSGRTLYSRSPLDRVEGTSDPGNKNRPIVYLFNARFDTVRLWKVNGTSFVTNSVYENGQLYATTKGDEDSKRILEYTDKEGRLILKKAMVVSGSINKTHAGWLCTYYVYDDFNRLRLVIQPRGVELLMQNNWTVNADILNEQCFRFEYDARQRVIMQKNPGSGEVWKVYDARDRVVLQQDANLRAQNKWMFFKYDALDRPIVTGFYVNNTHLTQAAMQNYLNTQNMAFFEKYQTTTFPLYSLNQSFPVVTASDVLTCMYYDDYSWAVGYADYAAKDNSFDSYFPAASNTQWPYPQSLTQNNHTKGLVTGVWQRIGNILTANYYDDKDRVIQTKTLNYTGGVDILTAQHSFSGQVLQSVLRHQKTGPNSQTHIVITKNTYDDFGRLLTIKKSVSSTIGSQTINSPEQTIVSHEYNPLGQLKKKKLGNKPSMTGVELARMDYEYNVRGWSKAINKSYITGSGNNDQYFGMELVYDRQASLGTFTHQFNGNVSGSLWKSETDQKIRKYDFAYDLTNRLSGANFNQYVSGAGTSAVFDISAGLDFSVSGLGYDANGNILSLNQKSWKLGGSTTIDSLLYNYYANSNRLKNVVDRVNDTATRLGDFRSSKLYMTSLSNNKTETATDYTYDANGNLVKDLNKDIDDVSNAGIEYNHLNLPVKIRVKNKGIIEFVYDADGVKLKKIVTEGTRITTTLYMAGFEYINDTLQQIAHEEGRIRLEKSTTATCPPLPARYVYDYFLRDHLGNVRMVLTEEQPSECYIAATVEDARVLTEQQLYHIVPSRIIPKSTTGATQSSFENKLYRVHGGLTDEKTGLGIVVKVMSGDKVIIKGESFYTLPGGGNVGVPLTVALSELLMSFVGSGAGSGKGVTSTADLINIPGNSINLNSFVNSNNPGTNTAKAAINWILLDEQFKFVTGDFDGIQSGGGYKNHTKFISNPVNVSKSGYLYIYVSNESNLPVYFDNLQITHTRGPILETNEYYPFGLTMAGISSRALKPNYFENKKKYQSYEIVKNFDLNLHETFYRSHDPQIGRWWQMDPKPNYVESMYSTMANNPIRFGDLLGDTTIVVTAGGAISGIKDDGSKLVTGKVSGVARTSVSVGPDGVATIVAKVQYQKFKLNDPALVLKAIRNGVINRVEFISDEKIERQIARSGVKTPEAQNHRWSYAKSQGAASGSMDYAIAGDAAGDLNRNTLYVTNGIGYDIADFGNFLFGRGMAELGFELVTTQLGAQYNHIFNNRLRGTDGTPVFNLGPGTYDPDNPGWFDAASDQRAIMNGFGSSPRSIKIWEERMKGQHNHFKNWRPY